MYSILTDISGLPICFDGFSFFYTSLARLWDHFKPAKTNKLRLV